MSTHIVGFRPPDDTWKHMKEIWDSCESVKVPIPEEVLNFFNDIEPDENGVENNLENYADEYSGDMRSGYEIDISKLPKNINIIRFFNSY